ncbi:MAG: bifunctional diaminohydroxyphosphoribosylaminopyrimidine deaminase/5-amino-6-(5-phosphoribosylamino)uracil reductase RibD [Betaproteobacteria bacterium]
MNPEESVSQCGDLARSVRLICPPNPAVGCVLTTSDGRLLGLGATQASGGAHAEVMALRDAARRGLSAVGATAYVSLEPCSHQGRTGPCCDALIQAGVKKVVAAIADPNPLVAGQGFARLRAAGVQVLVGPGADESFELNIGFFSRMLRARPWVRLKLAASLDGKTALHNGRSQWITGEAARADGHAWRARACAILSGVGTVLQDNPRLDVRGLDTPRQPALVLVDSQLQTPVDAALFGANRSVTIYAALAHAQRQRALQARGATVVYLGQHPGPLPGGEGENGSPNEGLRMPHPGPLPRREGEGTAPNRHRQVDLAALLRHLHKQAINELHVEAGHRLNGSLLRAGLVDELLVYLAPKLLGQGCDMASLGPLSELAQALPLTFQSTTMMGADLRILARLHGAAWRPN